MGNTISGHNLDGLYIHANGDNWVIVENTVTWNNLDRDAYLQRRLNLVYDGNPPESE